MTANDDQDDKQPPTKAAAGSDETEVGPAADTTKLAPPVTVAASGLAWSDDGGDSGDDYSWGRAAERASIIVLAAVAAAVVVGLLAWLGLSLYGQTAPAAAPNSTRVATIEPAAVLPPSTVTVTAAPPVTVAAAPPPTVTVQAAPPPEPTVVPPPALPPPAGGTHVFAICPDGHEGVVGGHTSCAFAENVRRTFYNSGMSNEFTAYSPITGEAYEITCVGRYPAHFTDGSTLTSTRCFGGDNAEVVIW